MTRTAKSVTIFFVSNYHQHTNNHAFKTDDSCLVKCIDGDIKMSIFGFYHSDFFRRRVEGEKYFEKTRFCVGTCLGGFTLENRLF